MSNQLQRQIEREHQTLYQSQQKSARQKEKMFEERPVDVLRGSLGKIIKKLKGTIDEKKNSSALKHVNWEMIEPSGLADFTIRYLLESVINNKGGKSIQELGSDMSKILSSPSYDYKKIDGEWKASPREKILSDDLEISDKWRVAQYLISAAHLDDKLFIKISDPDRDKRKKSARLELSQKCRGMIYRKQLPDETFFLEKPMICEPRPRTADGKGGYLTRDIPLFSGYFDVSGDLTKDVAALNRMQSTAFQINSHILNWALRLDAAKMARNKQKKKKAKALQERAAKTLALASECRDELAIYFPCFMDFRGRKYYRATFLSPQGDDLSKALLQFSRPAVIRNDKDAKWLLVHCANLFGQDKETLDKRVDWTIENRSLLEGIAEDPAGYKKELVKTGKFWQALAAAIEVTSYFSHKADGLNFQTRLPVAIDFTTNAFQIMSALYGDEKTAQLTNVVPSKRVYDLYDDIAKECGNKIKRKHAKRVVMLDAYGAVDATKREALIDEGFDYKEAVKAVDEISKKLMDVCPAIGNVKEHIRNRVKGAVKDKKPAKPFSFTTPTGLTMNQYYMGSEPLEISSTISNKTIKHVYHIYDPEKPSRKNYSAAAPNVIHAIDGAIVANTVIGFGGDLIAIHDCFAARSPEVERLAQAARDAFADVVGAVDIGLDKIGLVDVERARDSTYLIS